MEEAEPMTLAEAERLAAKDGLVLVPASNATGFKGVTGYGSNRYKAQINFGSKTKSLGIFSSAAEAALVHARHIGPAGCVAALGPRVVPKPKTWRATPMTEAEARRLAAAEGLVLVPGDNVSGWKGVTSNGSNLNTPYAAKFCQNGKQRSLGSYTTAVEAALAYARKLGPAGCAAAVAPPAVEPVMAEAEARRLAEAEGLQLVPSDNASGYRGVFPNGDGTCRTSKPFKAQCRQGGTEISLGTFSSAAEAALAVARFLGPERCAAAAAPPAALQPPMTEEEARRLAAAEGLELLPADNATGFKGVTRNSKSPTFSAKMRLGNKIHNLGCSFRSAAEAALVVARFLGPPPVEPPAAAAPPMMMLLAAAAAHDVPDSSERLLRADSSECLPPHDEPAAVSGVKRSREESSGY